MYCVVSLAARAHDCLVSVCCFWNKNTFEGWWFAHTCSPRSWPGSLLSHCYLLLFLCLIYTIWSSSVYLCVFYVAHFRRGKCLLGSDLIRLNICRCPLVPVLSTTPPPCEGPNPCAVVPVVPINNQLHHATSLRFIVTAIECCRVLLLLCYRFFLVFSMFVSVFYLQVLPCQQPRLFTSESTAGTYRYRPVIVFLKIFKNNQRTHMSREVYSWG
jgi:hypothetical protein